jgi:hypothetical protein
VDWLWQFQLLGESAWHDIGVTSHRIYAVLRTPLKPWAQDPFPDKINPWTEVLDYSCLWATGVKAVDEAAGRITRAVNAPVAGIGYDMNAGKCHYTDLAVFNGTAFLDRLRRGNGSPSSALVNCSDCAAIVSTFANAVGCDLDQSEMRADFGLNPIIAIGQPGFGFPAWGPGFGYHEVAWLGGKATDPLWDACLKTNQNGEHDPKVPVLPVNAVFQAPYRPQLVPVPDHARCLPDPETTFRREVV